MSHLASGIDKEEGHAGKHTPLPFAPSKCTANHPITQKDIVLH